MEDYSLTQDSETGEIVSLGMRSPLCRDFERLFDLKERGQLRGGTLESLQYIYGKAIVLDQGVFSLRSILLKRVTVATRECDRAALVEEGLFTGWVLDCPAHFHGGDGNIFLLGRPIDLNSPVAVRRSWSRLSIESHTKNNSKWLEARRSFIRELKANGRSNRT